MKWLRRWLTRVPADFKQEFKNGMKRIKRQGVTRREKQDDLIDCIGKEVKDIVLEKWSDNARIIFTDGTELVIEIRIEYGTITNNTWQLREVNT